MRETASHSTLFRRPSQGVSLSLNNILIPRNNLTHGPILSNSSSSIKATAWVMLPSVNVLLDVSFKDAFIRSQKFACTKPNINPQVNCSYMQTAKIISTSIDVYSAWKLPKLGTRPDYLSDVQCCSDVILDITSCDHDSRTHVEQVV